MVNIKKGGLKGERVRPQSIRPLIKFPRGINSDQAISLKAHDGECERAPWSGPKASSFKLQAASFKPQAQFRMIQRIILRKYYLT